MTLSGRDVPGTPASGLVWLWRLAAFVALFLALSFAFTLLSVLLGAPREATLSWWTLAPLLGAAVLTSWVAMRTLEGRPLAALGLPVGPGAVRGLALGTAVGLVLIGAVVATLWLAGWLRWVPAAEPGSPFLRGAVLALLLAPAAFTEELLFRGYPFQLVARRFGGGAAIVATSVVFAVVHAANPNADALSLLNIGFAGALLGLAYWRTRSLWFATGVHFGWNWTMAVSDLSVSGLPLGMPGFDPRVSGPEVLTGGAFGPEGGLLVTLASLAGIVWLWRSDRPTRTLGADETMQTLRGGR